jgi:hypothetical protein
LELPRSPGSSALQAGENSVGTQPEIQRNRPAAPVDTLAPRPAAAPLPPSPPRVPYVTQEKLNSLIRSAQGKAKIPVDAPAPVISRSKAATAAYCISVTLLAVVFIQPVLFLVLLPPLGPAVAGSLLLIGTAIGIAGLLLEHRHRAQSRAAGINSYLERAFPDFPTRIAKLQEALQHAFNALDSVRRAGLPFKPRERTESIERLINILADELAQRAAQPGVSPDELGIISRGLQDASNFRGRLAVEQRLLTSEAQLDADAAGSGTPRPQ